MKYWEITTVMLMAAGLMVASVQAQPPMATVECTFTHVDPVKLRLQGYSNTKVAPKDMAWLRPDDVPYMRPGAYTTQLGFVVLGKGTGHLTTSTDLRKLCTQFAKLASDHGANAISYQIFNQGTQIRLQFLRMEDSILKKSDPDRIRHRETILGNNCRQTQQGRLDLGLCCTVDALGRTIFVADAHRDDGKRYVVHADEKLTGVSGT